MFSHPLTFGKIRKRTERGLSIFHSRTNILSCLFTKHKTVKLPTTDKSRVATETHSIENYGSGAACKSAMFCTIIPHTRSTCEMQLERGIDELDHYLSAMSEKHFFTLLRKDYRSVKLVLDMTEHGMQRHYLQSERAGGYVSPEDQLALRDRSSRRKIR
jgi:hypothetical protein